ncbi:MAG: hypothetical protein ACO25Q_06905 [Sediminibacterium sp.]|jgi:hypothetical protein
MEFLAGLIIGFLLALVVIKSLAVAYKQISDEKLDEKIKEGLEKLKETIIPSRIEISNGMLYLYNSETNEFLGQGKTMQELNDAVKKRFPNKLFNVPDEQLKKAKINE